MAKPAFYSFALFAAVAAIVFRFSVHITITSPLLSDLWSPAPVTSNNEEPLVASTDVKVLSYNPFIAHVANLVSPAEREYLIQLSKPMMERSTVLYANGSKMLSEERTSSTAYLPTTDSVVQTIFRRAAEFQGYVDIGRLDMQVTSYQQGQQYRPHWDWFLEPNRTTNRLSTFFAILEADCENCGTQFPKIRADWSQRDQRWCEIVDCSQEVLTTRNIPGGAVFWRNLDNEGKGRDDVLHAGLPALNGSKIGLNIWTDVDLDRFKASKEGSTVLRP